MSNKFMISRRAMLLAGMMGASAYTAAKLRPHRMLADELPPIALDKSIPTHFTGWGEEKGQVVQVVDPVTRSVLDKLYSEIFARTYVNASGVRMMLSIAYGRNQRDDNSLHYPDVCYPAQGFTIKSKKMDRLVVNQGRSLPVKRLVAVLNQRVEPVTYWVTIGDVVVFNAKEQKLAQLRYGFQGIVPDGMLVRVSSIGPDADLEWRLQAEFMQSLLAVTPEKTRNRIIGVSSLS